MKLIRFEFTLAVVATFLMLFAVVPAIPLLAAPETSEASTVVHLSKYTNDLHAVMMALKLGTAIQEKNGDVVLFVDLEGARLADRRLPANFRWGPSNATVEDLYTAFIEAGGRVAVCPHCAMAAGIAEADLREGVAILTADGLGDLFAGADKVLDY